MKPGAGTGLLGSGYEQLSEAKGGIDESMRGQAFGAGAAQLASGLTGMAGDKLGAQLGDMFGKWKAGRTGLSGYESGDLKGMGNVLGLDATAAERFSPGMKLFEDPASMTGYGGFGMKPQGFQSGGALGKTFGLSKPSFNTYDPNKTKSWMSMVDTISGDTDARSKALAELGGMKHAESAKESEDIYQKSLGDMDRGNLESLLGMTKEAVKTSKYGPDKGTGVRELSGPFEGGYYYADKGLVDVPRQMQRPKYQQEELAPMMNPFTGEPLGELRATELPQGLQKLIPEGTYKGDEWLSSIPEEGMQQYLQGTGKGYEDIVSGLEYGTRQPEQSLMDRLLGRGQQQLPKGSGRRLRELMGDENYFAEGMQMGGMMPGGVSNALPYNLGGSVQQQPMAYQLGGLLKYKRSPMMG
jgi:hypothetical protein